MASYCLILDQLPPPAQLRRVTSEVFDMDLASVHVGRMYESDGAPPATVNCEYIDLDGGEFVWRLDIDTADTTTGPPEAELAAALCRRFAVRALLATAYPEDQWWRLVTPAGERDVELDLNELDEDRYVLVSDRAR